MYRLTTKKLSDVELEWEELSTKFDEANQTIGALRFENNFLAEKTRKLEAELFQVRAQLERTPSAKLDEMLNLQKSASDRTNLGYDFSSSSIASASTTIFVPPANNVETENNEVKNELASENINKGKSILGAPPKLAKNETKNPRAKKTNSQKPKQKKQHLCHHCGVAGHTQPNCYKWLATQQNNSMIALGNQNQFPSPSLLVQRFTQRKGSSKLWKEKSSKWLCHFLSLLVLFFYFYLFCITCVFCFIVLSQSSFYALLCLTCFCLFSVLFIFFHIKINK